MPLAIEDLQIYTHAVPSSYSHSWMFAKSSKLKHTHGEKKTRLKYTWATGLSWSAAAVASSTTRIIFPFRRSHTYQFSVRMACQSGKRDSNKHYLNVPLVFLPLIILSTTLKLNSNGVYDYDESC